MELKVKPQHPMLKKMSNKVTCIDARPESLLEEGKEYEIEKFDQRNRCYLLKDVPHHREPERFKREDEIDLEVFQDFNQMREYINDYNQAVSQAEDEESSIKSKIRRITEKYGKSHKEYRDAICKEDCESISIYR